MFEFIRTHQRLMQFLLLLLIVPAFVIGFGLQGYNGILGDDPSSVAKVCGSPISLQEFQRSQQDYMAQMSQQFGANFRPEMLDTPEMRASVLDRLVNQRVLACTALKRNMNASDEVLRQNILNDKNFKNPTTGAFDKDLYLAVLTSNGLSPEAYQSLLRQQVAMAALSSGVLETSFAPQAVQDQFVRAQEEQREVQDLIIKPTDFTGQVKLAPDAVKNYYDQNQKEFQVPPQLRAEYLVLSADTLAANIKTDPDEIKKYYEQNQGRYGIPEQRQARHILIPVDEKAPAAEIAAAKAKAESVLAEVKAAPDKFAEFAKKYSKDPGSAEKGGDLDFVSKGSDTFVKPFQDKIFELKEKEIGLVQSNFGFHIVQVTAIKPSSVKPFEEVRGEIEAEWKKQRAQKLFAESSDGFADLVYTQSDSLKPAADKYKLTVQNAPLFTRTNPPKELGYDNLLAKLFSDDAIKSKRNTEAVQVAPGVMVSARVVEYKPQTVQPFDEVKAAITAKLTQREARAMAKKEGEAKLKAVQASNDAAGFGAAKVITRGKGDGVAPDALRTIMGAPATKLPTVIGVDLADGSYGLYRINKVSQPEKSDPALREAIKGTLARTQSEADFNAYLVTLKAAAKVVLHPENIEKKPN